MATASIVGRRRSDWHTALAICLRIAVRMPVRFLSSFIGKPKLRTLRRLACSKSNNLSIALLEHLILRGSGDCYDANPLI